MPHVVLMYTSMLEVEEVFNDGCDVFEFREDDCYDAQSHLAHYWDIVNDWPEGDGKDTCLGWIVEGMEDLRDDYAHRMESYRNEGTVIPADDTEMSTRIVEAILHYRGPHAKRVAKEIEEIPDLGKPAYC